VAALADPDGTSLAKVIEAVRTASAAPRIAAE
jgi:hypothetical protein